MNQLVPPTDLLAKHMRNWQRETVNGMRPGKSILFWDFKR
jgi:hypothetical protein